MGNKTKIEWTEVTWNPLRGCTRVSEGCRHCYAEAVAARFSGPGQAYEGLAVMIESGPRWTGEVRFVSEHLRDPLKWKRPRRVFVNSMSDLFHERLSFEEIDAIFAVMSLSKHHVFQVLTKRPERMLEYIGRNEEEWEARKDSIGEIGYGDHGVMFSGAPDCGEDFHYLEWPLPNVWLGVSAENQKAADERIPPLLQTPAAVRWLSIEPLLGDIDLGLDCIERDDEGEPFFLHDREALHPCDYSCRGHEIIGGIDWVVVGGESGPEARPMHPDWVRSLRWQCNSQGVPFFFKQWGCYVEAPAERMSGVLVQLDGRHDPAWFQSIEERARYAAEGPVLMNWVGKKKAGRVLDGRTWDEYPIGG